MFIAFHGVIVHRSSVLKQLRSWWGGDIAPTYGEEETHFSENMVLGKPKD